MFSCNASIVTVFCWLGVSWNKSFYAKSLSLNHGTIQTSHMTNKDCLHNTILKKKKGQGKELYFKAVLLNLTNFEECFVKSKKVKPKISPVNVLKT